MAAYDIVKQINAQRSGESAAMILRVLNFTSTQHDMGMAVWLQNP